MPGFNDNCKNMISDYLMNNNPIYKNRGILSIIVAIITIAIAEYHHLSSNSFVNQLIIPISMFIVTMALIDTISRMLLSKDKMTELHNKCKLMINDPNFSNNPGSYIGKNHYKINMDKVAKYNGNISGYHFTQDGKGQMLERFQILDPALRKKRIPLTRADKHPENNIDNVPLVYSDNEAQRKLPLKAIDSSLNSGLGSCLINGSCCTLCSGGTNKCKVVAPSPGPQWQPQSAKSVQERLMKGDYVPSTCPLY